MISNNQETRDKLIYSLAEEYAKSICKQLLINEKYQQHNFSFNELYEMAYRINFKLIEKLREAEIEDKK